MNEAINHSRRFSRLFKHILLGSVFSGVLSCFPFIGFLNCLFCILNMIGIIFALWMYLRANPDDTIATGESVEFGALSGAGGGIIFAAVSLLFYFDKFREGIEEGIANNPSAEAVEMLANNPAMVDILIGVSLLFIVFLFSAFGLLGAFLGMKLFFQKRIRQT